MITDWQETKSETFNRYVFRLSLIAYVYLFDFLFISFLFFHFSLFFISVSLHYSFFFFLSFLSIFSFFLSSSFLFFFLSRARLTGKFPAFQRRRCINQVYIIDHRPFYIDHVFYREWKRARCQLNINITCVKTHKYSTWGTS